MISLGLRNYKQRHNLKDKKMTKISNYDEYKYDYREYWKDRDYEHKAEMMIIKKYTQDMEGKFVLDIGGSFGRLLEVAHFGKITPIIADYSLETLKLNKKFIRSRYPRTRLVAANAYHLPFKNGTICHSLLVRILHHIVNQYELFSEVERVMKKDGFLIMEYANKLHLKARIKWLLTLNFKNYTTAPYQQPAQGNFEGVREGESSVFLNYHPRNITKLLHSSGFKVLKKTNCSFFRINFIKKTVPISLLLFFEKIFQKTLSWTNITPSIILKTQQTRGKKEKNIEKFEDILCCPKCKSDLKISKDKAECKKCKKTFKKDEGIWDFRI